MSDSNCMCSCTMKQDLEECYDKLAFLKDNWSSFFELESINKLSKQELKCSLCLVGVIRNALSCEEYHCLNRDIIRIIDTGTYIQNQLNILECQQEISELEKKM